MQKNQLFNILLYGLSLIPFLLLFATVFIIDRSLANGITSGKQFWFYGVMTVIPIAGIISYSVYRKKISVRLPDFLILFLSVIGIVVTYVHAGINSRLLLFVLLIALYFCFRVVLCQHKWYGYAFALILMVTGLVEAIWGLMQLYGCAYSNHYLFKTTGSFFNPGPYAGYIAMVFPVSLYYLLKDYSVFEGKKFIKRLLPFYIRFTISVLTFISILLVLPSTMSRAAWLAALGGSVLALYFYFSRKYHLSAYICSHKKRVFVITIILCICVIAGGIGMYYMKKDSADGRMLTWKISLQTVKNHPLGVGLGNFSGVYGDTQAEYFASGKATEQEAYVAGNPEYGFNEYLQLCIELGVVGLVVFGAIVVFTFWGGLRGRKYASICALTALLIFAFFSYPFSVLPYLVILVFLVAWCLSGQRFCIKCQRTNTVIVISVLMFSFVLATFCAWNRLSVYNAYIRWNHAKSLFNMKMYDNILEDYAENEPFLSDQIQFLFEYGQSLSKTGNYTESNRILNKATRISCDPMLYNIMGKNYQELGDYGLAEQNFMKAANLVPSRHYPYYLLAKLYYEEEDWDKFRRVAFYMLEKEPKVPSPAIEEMKTEIKALMEAM